MQLPPQLRISGLGRLGLGRNSISTRDHGIETYHRHHGDNYDSACWRQDRHRRYRRKTPSHVNRQHRPRRRRVRFVYDIDDADRPGHLLSQPICGNIDSNDRIDKCDHRLHYHKQPDSHYKLQERRSNRESPSERLACVTACRGYHRMKSWRSACLEAWGHRFARSNRSRPKNLGI
jgi:hypothetical protein